MGQRDLERAFNIKELKFDAHTELLCEDRDSATWRILDAAGFAEVRAEQIFSGTGRAELEIRSAALSASFPEGPDFLRIEYCLEGRAETGSVSLTSGDAAVFRQIGGCGEVLRYLCPTRFYRGISVIVRDGADGGEAGSLMEDMRPLCGEDGVFLLRNDPAATALFSVLDTDSESLRKEYQQLKTQELFLYLRALAGRKSGASADVSSDTEPAAKEDGLAKDVHAYLMRHLETRVTTEELAERFHVSMTQIKNSFRSTYGMPVYSYVRAQKMHAAAELLRSGDGSVLEIAGRFGYDNGSKFAKAFRDCIGLTPREYRRRNAKTPKSCGEEREEVHV